MIHSSHLAARDKTTEQARFEQSSGPSPCQHPSSAEPKAHPFPLLCLLSFLVPQTTFPQHLVRQPSLGGQTSLRNLEANLTLVPSFPFCPLLFSGFLGFSLYLSLPFPPHPYCLLLLFFPYPIPLLAHPSCSIPLMWGVEQL